MVHWAGVAFLEVLHSSKNQAAGHLEILSKCAKFLNSARVLSEKTRMCLEKARCMIALNLTIKTHR